MTEEKAANIINEAYGYEIINDRAKKELTDMKEMVLSKLGIETLYGFLSYDINEFSDIRKTIHARRFFQTYKKAFSLEAFDMEAFHKIQAACIFIAAVSGNMRGYKDYMYTGFVQNIFRDMGYYSERDDENSSTRQKLIAIENIFKSFNKLSVGIYSLQIYTRYSMAIDKIIKLPMGYASKLFLDIIDDFQKNKIPVKKIKKLASISAIKPENVEAAIDEYIDYAINDLSQNEINPEDIGYDGGGDTCDAIKQNARDYFSRYLDDAEKIAQLSEDVIDKLHILEKNPGNPDIAILYISLLRELTGAFEGLSYYEETSFARSLNNIFVGKAKELLEARAKREIDAVKNECISIIEENISGLTVFELDGIIAGLSGDKYKFDEFYDIDPEESQAALEELDDFLGSTLETIIVLRGEMRDRLRDIVDLETMTENEKSILGDLIYDFDSIIKFLTEDDQ